MAIIFLEHQWQVIRAADLQPIESIGKQHVPPWPRFAVFPSGTILRSASNAQAYPATDVFDIGAGSFRVAELPMPGLGGDSAYGEGVERYEGNDLIDRLPLDYPERYPVGDTDEESEFSVYEAFFDQMLNETLYLIRQVLKADHPRSPVTYWPSVLAELRDNKDNDPARHALIVDLAEALKLPMEYVTSHPKKTLKRIRDQQRVQLVQEVDMHCLMDLARRPGSTMPEKAGPKQRVMAVIRYESVDLLENRVARHCCELLNRAAARYLRSHKHVGNSDRKRQVEKLCRNSKRWPAKPMVYGVRSLVSPCRQPNYALLQNMHYSRIWDGYAKLVRNEELRGELWRWPRRLWMDRVGVYVADTVINWANRKRHAVFINTADRLLQARPRHDFGAWLSSDIMPGPFIISVNSAEAGSLYIINGKNAFRIHEQFMEASLLCADFLAFWVKGSSIHTLPIYATWPSPRDEPGWDEEERLRIAEDVLESVAQFNKRAKQLVAIGAVIIQGLWDAKNQERRHTTIRADLKCWQIGLHPDVSSWSIDVEDRYSSFDALIGS